MSEQEILELMAASGKLIHYSQLCGYGKLRAGSWIRSIFPRHVSLETLTALIDGGLAERVGGSTGYDNSWSEWGITEAGIQAASPSTHTGRAE